MVIGKKTLNKYEFKTIEDYFSYIVDSQINGNSQQVKDLFKKLDNGQKKTFFNYLKMIEVSFDFSGLY